MSMTIVDVREIRPIDRGEAMELATIGYERLLSLVDDLEADDWERSTDCEAWTIKDIVSHLLGEAEAFASMREFVHQFRISSREGTRLRDPTGRCHECPSGAGAIASVP